MNYGIRRWGWIFLAFFLVGFAAAPLNAQVASLNPRSLNFGGQVTGTTSSAATVSLTNTGRSNLTIAGIAAGAPFSQTNNCPAALAPNAHCSISVKFSPTSTGSFSSSLSVTDNASGSPQKVSLSGTGVPPVALSPASLNFGNDVVGTTSNPGFLTLHNNLSSSITISSIQAAGDFAQTNNCGSNLSRGANCSIRVTFKPTTTGARTGSITVQDSAGNSPQSASLSGNGILFLNESPGLLAFGNQPDFTTSPPKTITLSNPDPAPVSISSIVSSGDFAETNNCVPSLPAHSSCAIQVTFTPTVTGTRTGLITISDNALSSPQTVSLTGRGTAPTVTLTSISVTPANPSIAKGLTEQFTATGTYSNGTTQNITSTVAWSSATTSVATITSGGLAKGVGVGTSTIKATSGSVSGSTVLTVTAATLTSISVTPANPSIVKGSTRQFTATGTYSDSTTQNITGQRDVGISNYQRRHDHHGWSGQRCWSWDFVNQRDLGQRQRLDGFDCNNSDADLDQP